MARTYEEDKQEVRKAVQTILDALNGGRPNELAAVIHNTVSRDHRTLQQAFWSTILLAQIAYADNMHDGRNEQAVQLAKLVRDAARQHNMDMGLMYI